MVLGCLHCGVTALTVPGPDVCDLWLITRQHKWETLTSNTGKCKEAAIPLSLFKLHKGSQGNHMERNPISQMNNYKSSHGKAIGSRNSSFLP